MSSVKAAISLERPLLARIDEVAAELSVPRSRLLARAAEDFLRRHESRRMLDALDRAYADEALTEEEHQVRQAHRRRLRQRAQRAS